MAQVYCAARRRCTVSIIPPAVLRLTGITVFKSGCPGSKRAQRGSMAQSIRAAGKESRSAAAAGSAWTTSPKEPSRKRRKRWAFSLGVGSDAAGELDIAGIVGLAQAREKIAGGMVFGVADNGDANAEQGGHVAFGDGVGRVIGAFGVNVGLKFAEKLLYVGLVENDDVVHGLESNHHRREGAFGEDGPALTFQVAGAGGGINADDEKVAFGARRLQIAYMADVEQIENAVGEDDFFSGLA